MTQSPPEIIQPLHIENLLWGNRGDESSRVLKMARLLVGLEYLSFVAYYATVFLFVAGDVFVLFFPIIAGAVFAGFYYCLCGFGIGMMGKWLQPVCDRKAVELWAYIALGVAPLSGFFYPYMVVCISDAVNPNAVSYSGWLLLAAFVGFYVSFILPVLWLRYHHREDLF